MKNCIKRTCYGAGIETTNRKRGRQCTYERGFKARSCFHCCRGKTISITYSECVSVIALLNQHVKCTRCIKLSSVASLTLPCFPTLSHKGHDLRESFIEPKFVLLFSLLLLSHSKKTLARYNHKCTLVFT